MDKVIVRVYTLFLTIACIIIAVYAIKGTGQALEGMFPDHTGTVISPVTVEEVDGAHAVTMNASDIISAGGCLSFTTSFMDVFVYAGEEEIYENVGPDSLLMRSNGNVWHFIRVSDDSNIITVKIKPAYDNISVTVPELIAGDYYNLRSKIVRDSTPALIISILDLICGIGIIVYSLISRKFRSSNFRMITFGIASVLMGIWTGGETNAMVILMENRALAAVIAFYILIFIPMPYILYIHSVLWPADKCLYRIPICCCLVDFILVTGLAFTETMDLKESVILTHIAWGTLLLYSVAAAMITMKNYGKRKRLSEDDKSKKASGVLVAECESVSPTFSSVHSYNPPETFISDGVFSNGINTSQDKTALFNAGAILILVVAALIEILYYWTGVRAQNDVFGRILVLCYIVLLACRNIRESLKEVEKGRMAAYYRKLANTDSLTGLFNRTAFNSDLEKLSAEKEYSIISMDLNNLKEVNDTKGHQAGDRYIINATGIIREVFGKQGSCYRIGGDEFCVIITRSGSNTITEELVQKLEDKIAAYNQSNPTEPLGIAWGYDSTDPDTIRDYSEILHSADNKMYERKHLQKESGKELSPTDPLRSWQEQ